MLVIYLLLYVLAIVLFLLAAFGAGHPRINLMCLGLAAWVAVPLIHAAQAVR